MKTIVLINLVILTFLFTGCASTQTQVLEPKEEEKIFKSEVLSKISLDTAPKYPMPYVKESKYIKILILPFKNSENDIDYGGILETKLEDSKFIFDDELKKKIIEESNSIGSI
jgi:hypothetical protein